MIKLVNVSKKYDAANKQVIALNEVNFKIKAQSITGVIGQSGAGKSTIIDLISGISKPDRGDIIINEKIINQLNYHELRTYQKNVGVVFQDYNLLENLSVINNVAMPLKLNRITKEERLNEALRMLDYVGLKAEANSYPSQLSGGERQRVAIARALINKPQILLLDEITSALDQENANVIIKLLKRINKEFKITILLVSHDLLTIKKLCDDVYIIKEGKIVDYVEKIKNIEITENVNYRNILVGDNNVWVT